jgi:epoxyqueuosine reductase
MAGSAILRIGHERWLRNIAVALGNSLRVAPAAMAMEIRAALAGRKEDASPLVREHVQWALRQEGEAAQSAA